MAGPLPQQPGHHPGAAGDTVAAEADLIEARRLYEERSHFSAVAEMTHNIGWVAGVAGDIPKALASFDEAEEGFRRLGYPLGEPLRDRSRVLASAQLTAEARAAASRAVDLLGIGGMAVARAEALLELSVASLLDGDPAAALSAATEARRSFRRQRRDSFAAQAVTAELAARAESRHGAPRACPTDAGRHRDLGKVGDENCGMARAAAVGQRRARHRPTRAGPRRS